MYSAQALTARPLFMNNVYGTQYSGTPDCWKLSENLSTLYTFSVHDDIHLQVRVAPQFPRKFTVRFAFNITFGAFIRRVIDQAPRAVYKKHRQMFNLSDFLYHARFMTLKYT